MVELQSVDFSRKIKSRPPAGPKTAAPERSASSGVEGKPASGRLLGYGMAAALLIFAAGLYSGIKIGQFKSFEQSLVKYPDGQKSPDKEQAKNEKDSLSSFANRPQESAEKEGNFIIKVGTFSEDRARELQGILESRPEIQKLLTLKCQSVSSSGALHQSIFRTEVKDARLQNLFFGCFSTVDTAGEALEELSKLNIAGTGSARVFEIDGK
ncbi:MAG: hypothetical protein CMN76_06415 [Spirochaetaceae bacterium]|nr:hypothetical protein [Spirochaetaceae bacterium]|tara:strand:- start:336928 stop:337560 length:633 start_codon:yes stop_codon:yes gene_type:complete